MVSPDLTSRTFPHDDFHDGGGGVDLAQAALAAGEDRFRQLDIFVLAVGVGNVEGLELDGFASAANGDGRDAGACWIEPKNDALLAIVGALGCNDLNLRLRRRDGLLSMGAAGHGQKREQDERASSFHGVPPLRPIAL